MGLTIARYLIEARGWMADDEAQHRKMRDYPALLERDGTINLPVRYVVILLSIIGVLVIALSVVLTVLIMRS